MRIQLKDLLEPWGTDRIKYFLSVKDPHAKALQDSVSWPKKIIINIEKHPLFAKFEKFTYRQMQDLTIACDINFNNQTQEIATLIDKIPHNYNLISNDFHNEKCLIMVDASIKKNGNEIFYGIAGCIRNESGNIVSGFAIPIYSKDIIESTTLVLMAIEKGVELAHSYNLKNYTVVTDCISNAIKAYKLKHGFIPMTQDYYTNEQTYLSINNILQEDNADVAYVPRRYNNIADQYSKSYMASLHTKFQENQLETESLSRSVLSGQTELSSNIYFYHDNLNSYLKNSPYDLEKNFQHNFVYDENKHEQYELYVMPFYNVLNKTIYNYSIDPHTQEYNLLFEYPVNFKQEGVNGAHFNNLERLLDYCKDKKTAIFTGNGLVAKTNKIATIENKEIKYYKKLYQLLDNVKEVSFFGYDTTLKNDIEKAIQKNNSLYSHPHIKM